MISKFLTDVTASGVHALPFGFHLFAYLSQRSMDEPHPVYGPSEAGRSIYPQGGVTAFHFIGVGMLVRSVQSDCSCDFFKFTCPLQVT